MDTKFFTPRLAPTWINNYSFNHPKTTRSEAQARFFVRTSARDPARRGGDFHYEQRSRQTDDQFGLYSQTTAAYTPSPAPRSVESRQCYRYVSKAYGGYHFNARMALTWMQGFHAYVGLFSYYQFATGLPAFVCLLQHAWFFTGVRVQIFPHRAFED